MSESLQDIVLWCDDGFDFLVASPPIASIEALRSALAPYRLPRTILTALELNLFSVMGAETWFVSKLAETHKVSDRGLDILCLNLPMCG